MAADLDALAALSHGLERVALALTTEGIDIRVVAVEVQERAAGHRESIAIALSYLLRRRNLGDFEVAKPLDDAIDALVAALRRSG